jgi:hypothetical protein
VGLFKYRQLRFPAPEIATSTEECEGRRFALGATAVPVVGCEAPGFGIQVSFSVEYTLDRITVRSIFGK